MYGSSVPATRKKSAGTRPREDRVSVKVLPAVEIGTACVDFRVAQRHLQGKLPAVREAIHHAVLAFRAGPKLALRPSAQFLDKECLVRPEPCRVDIRQVLLSADVARKIVRIGTA